MPKKEWLGDVIGHPSGPTSPQTFQNPNKKHTPDKTTKKGGLSDVRWP